MCGETFADWQRPMVILPDTRQIFSSVKNPVVDPG
jgi:hypothetical protein